MENLLSVKEKIKILNTIVQKIEKDGYSRIEKDIILQELRDIYLLVDNLENSPTVVTETVNKMPENPILIEKQEEQIQIEEKHESVVEFVDDSPIEEEVQEPVVVAETVIEKPEVTQETPIEKTQERKPVPQQQNLFATNNSNGVKTIGEQLGQNKTSLNERLSSTNTPNDVASKIGQKPINDIKAAIGIGDRFLYIRELFNGNNDDFEQTIQHLNSFTNFNQAQEYLNNNYAWDNNQETVANFINVVKRRYL
jgi:hypothetical protein